jgi:hypothetical protein
MLVLAAAWSSSLGALEIEAPASSNLTMTSVVVRGVASQPSIDGCQAPVQVGPQAWWFEVPADGVQRTVTAAATSSQVLIRPTARDLDASNSASAVRRVGDVLRLKTAHIARARLPDGSIRVLGTGNIQCQFDRSGQWALTSADARGRVISRFVVYVPALPYATERVRDVVPTGVNYDTSFKFLFNSYGAGVSAFYMQSYDPALVVRIPTIPKYRVNRVGDFPAVIRYGGAQGEIAAAPILRAGDIDVSRIVKPNAVTFLPDGTRILSQTLRVTNVGGLSTNWYRLRTFAHRSTFIDGSTDVRIDIDDPLTPWGTTGFVYETQPDGRQDIRLDFEMLVPPGESSYCIKVSSNWEPNEVVTAVARLSDK